MNLETEILVFIASVFSCLYRFIIDSWLQKFNIVILMIKVLNSDFQLNFWKKTFNNHKATLVLNVILLRVKLRQFLTLSLEVHLVLNLCVWSFPRWFLREQFYFIYVFNHCCPP